ncbi:SDR family oxidoreductase [Methylonatrum kenyense]|uniref:SDR family oxidoreductase n=1 Tax=Methylonatrum kenyense TaxID=455253 RepID=UPI0020C00B52|nr:SDR family oxidoreductase [Methylonatrum kenyense]MCK8515880.1 SDR family oxidoreductase [Methylonatrum kenyense]
MQRIVITGANRGIGLELVRQLQARGDEVIACCRRRSTELEATGARIEDGLDVADPGSIRGLRRRLDGQKVDMLLNVAGIMRLQQFGAIDDQALEAMREQYDVNALGPLLMTQALADLMPDGAKVGIVTSRMGSIADNTSGGSYGYRMSKVAVNMAGASLAHDLRDRGIAVAVLHPGFVRTDMTEGRGMIDPPESAAGLIARMDELTMESSGGFWHTNGERLPW